MTSFYGSSCANNGKDALNTPDTNTSYNTLRTYNTAYGIELAGCLTVLANGLHNTFCDDINDECNNGRG
eukprot:1056897-Prorocentrum_minimum.AAC.1